MEHSTSVVVFPSGHHGGLGIVRSLGRLSVPVYCVDPSWHEPASVSRYCRRRFLLKPEGEGPTRSVQRLLEIGKHIGGMPILIPTTDQTAIWVGQNARQLRKAFRFPEQSPTLLQSLCDKGRMQSLADHHGVATARSIVPKSKEDVLRYLESAKFPVMVKATDAMRLRLRAGGTKFIIQTPRELLALYSTVEEDHSPSLLIQEFIPGEDWMFNGYFDANSKCLFGITGKKVRRFPAHTGVTSLGICLRNEIVKQTSIEFMQAIRYCGIVDIGYRRDGRDGRYKILDVNPRIGCTFRLFLSTDGFDVARSLYFDLTGQEVPLTDPAEGRRWMVEDFDLFSAACSVFGQSLTLRQWIASLRGVQETACFSVDDPLPSLMMFPADWFELQRWLYFKLRTCLKTQRLRQEGLQPPTPAIADTENSQEESC